jgi:hypothetical protein
VTAAYLQLLPLLFQLLHLLLELPHHKIKGVKTRQVLLGLQQ